MNTLSRVEDKRSFSDEEIGDVLPLEMLHFWFSRD